MKQQSNTPEYFNAIIARIERERDEARKMQRDRTDERDAALRDRYLWEQERDQLRKVADELAADLLARGGGTLNHSIRDYNNLPHVIARKESKI